MQIVLPPAPFWIYNHCAVGDGAAVAMKGLRCMTSRFGVESIKDEQSDQDRYVDVSFRAKFYSQFELN